jgi:hypothetical protein
MTCAYWWLPWWWAAAPSPCKLRPVPAPQIARAQHLRETTFLQLLVHTLRTAAQAAEVLCDRGVRRVRWLAHLQ